MILLSSLQRLPEEATKFKHLFKMLIWLKIRTGKPSGEIIHAILTRSNRNLAPMVHENSCETYGLII